MRAVTFFFAWGCGLAVGCSGTGTGDDGGDTVVPSGPVTAGGHAGKGGAAHAGSSGNAGASGVSNGGASGHGGATTGQSGASGSVATGGTSNAGNGGSSGASSLGGSNAGGASNAGGTSNAGSTSVGGASTGGSAKGGNAGTSVGPMPTSCSPDLHTVLDQNGQPLTTCAADQGCLNAMCVPACTAAASTNGSSGCDFYAPVQPFFDGIPTYNGSCYAAFVANTWGKPAMLQLSRNGQSFDVTKFAYIPSGTGSSIQYTPLPATGLPADQVAILFLAQKTGTNLPCPVPTAISTDVAVHGSGEGEAFHITSDTPLDGYDILPYGGASTVLPSASLLFPSTSWGTNYFGIAPRNVAKGGIAGRLWMMLVGSQDGTTVTISAKGAALPAGGGAPAVPSGGSATVMLNAGQTVQWEDADPTGTVIQSSSPVGMFSGTTYLCISSATSPQGGGCDSSHQEVPQIKAFGDEYVLPGIKTRLSSGAPESVPYKLLGAVDGTTLTWNPTAPAGAPTTLNAGQAVEFETTELLEVASQDENHPFLVTEYMPGTPGASGQATMPGCGQSLGLPSCDLGDDEWVMVLPPAQFLDEYVFFTDPTYATTNLVVTRVKGPSGFEDVTVECIGSPITGWQDVGTDGTYQVASLNLRFAGQPTTPACETSRHKATSSGRFGVTVWGLDQFASYGYPAGGSLASINQVVVKP